MEDYQITRIYLVGYSYSGKTTMGRQLAKRLGYAFFDTDKAVELKYHTTIPMIFSRYGEKAFRIIETQILQSTATLEHTVISTGGGTPCNKENMDFILSHGLAVYLKMGVEDIMERLSHARRSRPSLAGKNTDEIRRFVSEQLEQRIPFYSQAHLSLDALHATSAQIEQLIMTIPDPPAHIQG